MEKKFRLLEMILNEIPALIFILDIHGKITFANRTAITASGYTQEDIGSLNIYKLLDKSSFQELLRQRDSLDKGNAPQLQIYNIITANGDIVTVEGHAARIENEPEEPIYLGVAYDIRERLEVEAERSLMQEEIFKLQKMDIIGHLVSDLIHDSNNILTGLMGKLNILAKPIGDLKNKGQDQSASIMPLVLEIQEIVEQASALADQIANMNRRLLNFARQEEPSIEQMDIRFAVEAGLEICADAIRRKKITISRNYQSELPWVLANAEEIKRVVINILFNAIDAISDAKEGKIEIVLRLGQLPKLASGDFVVIAISDNGYGMSEETKARIFEPFFTTKGINKGTGLGLSISAALIKKCNGWIDCESKDEQGSTFAIYLPILVKK